MAETRPADLEEVRRALMKRLNEDVSTFLLLNTRVILRTGINLSQINPHQAKDPKLVLRVLAALSDMGFSFQTLAKKG